MTWLAWRLQRTETALALGLLLVITAVFVPAGLHLASAYTHDGVAACIDRRTQACFQTLGAFGGAAGAIRSLLGWFNLLIGLVGVALAAPLVLDLESGATTFAWTQSVTRARWLATRFGLAVATALAAGGAFSLLIGWYRGPLDAVWGGFSDGAFDLEGIVPVAYTAFALGLGLAVGALWRRTAPAMVVAFLAYFGARISVDTVLRAHFVTPLTATWGPGSNGPNLQRAWVLFEGPSNRAGHVFHGSLSALDRCSRVTVGDAKNFNQHCLDRIGAGFTHAVYQPASRFWEFQGIEFALFGGLAALLIAFAAWRVLKAD